MHFFALARSDFNRYALHSLKIDFRAGMLIRISGVAGIGFDGNFSQKRCVAELPYALRVGISGNFLLNCLAVVLSVGDGVIAAMVEKSQNMT